MGLLCLVVAEVRNLEAFPKIMKVVELGRPEVRAEASLGRNKLVHHGAHGAGENADRYPSGQLRREGPKGGRTMGIRTLFVSRALIFIN